MELPLEAWLRGVEMHDAATLKFFFVWHPRKSIVSVHCKPKQGTTTVVEEICTSQIEDIKVCIVRRRYAHGKFHLNVHSRSQTVRLQCLRNILSSLAHTNMTGRGESMSITSQVLVLCPLLGPTSDHKFRVASRPWKIDVQIRCSKC